jgi:hypothetical protein
MCGNAPAQQQVLLVTPRQWPRRTLDDPPSGDDLAIPELLTRQIELHPAR